MMTPSRLDFRIIADWIRPHSRVLDLGCGDGSLLDYLAQSKGVSGYGLEIDDADVGACIKRGVNVIQTDLNAGLSEFDERSFDFVILSLTLQAVKYPDRLLREMLRVGTEGIVTFPNFGHWRTRWQLGLLGRMPISPALPHDWYNTPNIHLCTLRDFAKLCRDEKIEVLESEVVDHAHRQRLGFRLFPNMLGEIALYRFRRAALP